jgi:hypothetical protein
MREIQGGLFIIFMVLRLIFWEVRAIRKHLKGEN